MLEPYERGCATIVANDGRGIARNRPFGPVAAGGDGADSRPTRQTVGAYPRLKSQAPIVPAPAVLRQLRRSPQASTGRQRGGGERSANRLRTRCGRASNRYGLFCQVSSSPAGGATRLAFSRNGSISARRAFPARATKNRLLLFPALLCSLHSRHYFRRHRRTSQVLATGDRRCYFRRNLLPAV